MCTNNLRFTQLAKDYSVANNYFLVAVLEILCASNMCTDTCLQQRETGYTCSPRRARKRLNTHTEYILLSIIPVSHMEIGVCASLVSLWYFCLKEPRSFPVPSPAPNTTTIREVNEKSCRLRIATYRDGVKTRLGWDVT